MKTVAVIALLQNCAQYFESYLANAFIDWEEYDKSKYTFEYYFLENDSIDDTRGVLQRFMTGRAGRLITRDNVEKGRFTYDAVTYERVGHFVNLRNILLDETRARLAEVDFVAIIDADTTVHPDTFAKLANVLEENDDIAMVCPYQYEYTSKQNLARSVPLSAMEHIHDPIFSVGHNYDTFALQYTQDCMISWPYCRFKKCNMCSFHLPPTKAPRIDPDTKGLIEVKSAFNGLAVIKGTVFKFPTLKYDTINIASRAMALCEHTLFCHYIRVLTGKRIVIASDISIKAIVRVAPI